MTLQQEISQRKHQALVGRQDVGTWLTRTPLRPKPRWDVWQARRPTSTAWCIDGPVTSGDLVLVEITAAEAYDFTARVVHPAT